MPEGRRIGVTRDKEEGYTMFARLTIVQMQIDRLDEATKIMDESIIPAAKSQKGYRGAYLLTDKKTGKGIAISLWDSEEDAIANEQSGYYQEQLSKVKGLFTAPPLREGYEVSLQA
ncbi:MAG: antibiotic biosynthesis monooxygenase family protein [Nitrospinota bacterium]